MNTILATQSEYAARIEKDVRAYRTTKAASKPAVKSKTTKRVTGIEALNQMGKNHVNALSRDLERIKTQLSNASTPKQRRRAKVAMYINYTMTGIMGLPAVFLIGLVVKDLVQ